MDAGRLAHAVTGFGIRSNRLLCTSRVTPVPLTPHALDQTVAQDNNRPARLLLNIIRNVGTL